MGNTEKKIMNDPIKYLITGAAIAIIGGAAGATICAIVMRAQPTAGGAPTYSSPAKPPPAATARFQTSPDQFLSIPPRPPGSTNTRFAIPTPSGAISHAAFQKAQELPDVKKAREEFMEAQRKYVGLMQAAMGQPAASNQSSAVRNPKAK
jgi:hypothetical protein